MPKSNGTTGPLHSANMAFFVAAIGFGVAFIATSRVSNFFEFEFDNCIVKGLNPSDLFVDYTIKMRADIGWRKFTVSYLDAAAQADQCFVDITQDGEYSLLDFQNNNASMAGIGMVASWGVAVLVAAYTLLAMLSARNGMRRGGVSLKTLTNACALMCLGIIVATTVFWWVVEGKFGNRRESLVPRLYDLALDAADKCTVETVANEGCLEPQWDMNTPGWSLALGITAMFAYGAAVLLLWLRAARLDDLNSGTEEVVVEPIKAVVSGELVVEKMNQPEEKARAKDRRSAKTGVRAGGRGPISTVQGNVESGADPMTYALEGGDEELGSQDDEEEVVMYQNHQVHHNVINHSQPNRTQSVEESRQRQQYHRGYSRGTSGGSYATGGGQSFEDRSDADFSEASSAQYYAQNQGRSFMSASSQAESFDEYR